MKSRVSVAPTPCPIGGASTESRKVLDGYVTAIPPTHQLAASLSKVSVSDLSTKLLTPSPTVAPTCKIA